MSYTVDARGLACPQPVILTKKALEANSDVTVLVDNPTALENVKRMAATQGCGIEVAENGGIFEIGLKKGSGPASTGTAPNLPRKPAAPFRVRTWL